MNKSRSPVSDAYAQWRREIHAPAQRRRTAAQNAAFLLPHLGSGMRLLDCGCGPGAITLGLAEAVAPGEVVGIDITPERMDEARALAAERGCTNVRFEVADVYSLPFPDATFDAAFVHALLQHLPDPLGALREVRRVLKPGGVIGVADADLGGSLMAPMTPALDRALDLLANLRDHDGGSPHVGRRLRALLHDAGFSRNVASVSCGCDGAEETARRTGEWWAGYLAAPAFVDHVVEAGLSDPRELEEMSNAWRS